MTADALVALALRGRTSVTLAEVISLAQLLRFERMDEGMRLAQTLKEQHELDALMFGAARVAEGTRV
jgi:hypothetical protein